MSSRSQRAHGRADPRPTEEQAKDRGTQGNRKNANERRTRRRTGGRHEEGRRRTRQRRTRPRPAEAAARAPNTSGQRSDAHKQRSTDGRNAAEKKTRQAASSADQRGRDTGRRGRERRADPTATPGKPHASGRRGREDSERRRRRARQRGRRKQGRAATTHRDDGAPTRTGTTEPNGGGRRSSWTNEQANGKRQSPREKGSTVTGDVTIDGRRQAAAVGEIDRGKRNAKREEDGKEEGKKGWYSKYLIVCFPGSRTVRLILLLSVFSTRSVRVR